MSDKEEELQDWINQVYYGNCCSHLDDEKQSICLTPKEKDKKESKNTPSSK